MSSGKLAFYRIAACGYSTERKEANEKENLLLAAAPIVAIIFAADPNGVTMRWGKRLIDGSIGFAEKHCAFFNPIAAAYGDAAPFLTAVLSVVLLVMCLACSFTRKVYTITKIVASLAFLSSAVALTTSLFVLSYVSFPGLIITVALAAGAVLTFYLLPGTTSMHGTQK